MSRAIATRAAPRAIAGSRPALVPDRALAERYASRARLWVMGMRLLIPAAALTLMVSQTQYLTANPIADTSRWSLLGAIAAMLVLRPRGRVKLRSLKLTDALFIAFFTLAFASMMYSTVPPLTMARTISAVLLYGAVFWTVWFHADVVGGAEVADTLIRAAFVMFVVGAASIFVTEESWLRGRFRGVFANPNAVGMLGIIFLPPTVAKMVRTRRMSSVLLVLLMAGSVVLSGSRNGVMTASLALIFMLYRMRAWRSGLLLATFTVIVVLVMPGTSESAKLAETPVISRLISGERLATGGGRVEAWEAAIPLIRERILLGYGFGTEELIFRGRRFVIHRGVYVHNSYLGLTYQVGLLGSSLVFIPLIGLLLSRIVKRRRISAQVAAYEAVLFGGLIASMFESWIYSAGNAFAFPFWTFTMLLIRASSGTSDPEEIAAVRVRRGAARTPYLRPRQPVSGSPPAIPRFDPPMHTGTG